MADGKDLTKLPSDDHAAIVAAYERLDSASERCMKHFEAGWYACINHLNARGVPTIQSEVEHCGYEYEPGTFCGYSRSAHENYGEKSVNHDFVVKPSVQAQPQDDHKVGGTAEHWYQEYLHAMQQRNWIGEDQAMALIEAYKDGYAVVDSILRAGLPWPPLDETGLTSQAKDEDPVVTEAPEVRALNSSSISRIEITDEMVHRAAGAARAIAGGTSWHTMMRIALEAALNG